MAESLSREEVAGIEWARWRESLDYQPTHASAWHDGGSSPRARGTDFPYLPDLEQKIRR